MSTSRITHEQLIAFAAGELSGAQAARVQAHLDTDAAARETVARYRDARRLVAEDDTVMVPPSVLARAKAIFRPRATLAPPASRPTWLDRVDALIATLVFDSRLQPIPVRSAGVQDRVQMTYEWDRASLDLQARRLAGDSSAARRWGVTGQVSLDEEPTSARVAPVRVAMVRGDDPAIVVQTQCDERGIFDLQVDWGVYELLIDLPERLVKIPDLLMP